MMARGGLRVWRENWIPTLSAMGTAAPLTAVANAEDVGARLRKARERRGLSLDELARLTKIRPTLLGAIETNRCDALPTTIFVRGFVYAYAREVGLDADETSREYLDQFALAEPAAEDTAASAEPTPHSAPLLGRIGFRNAAIAMAIGAVVIVYSVAHRTTSAASRVTAARAQAAPAAPRQAVATSGSSAPAAVGAAGHDLHVDMAATGKCWVSATVDGTRVVYQLMQPGQHRSLTVKDGMALRVGEPSALTLTINGAAARPLGAPGHPATVRITPENFRNFVR